MKRKTAFVSLAVLLLLVGLAWVCFWNEQKGPVISIKSEKQMSEEEYGKLKAGDDSFLLSNVVAVDQKDGDVTDTLRIERVVILTDGSGVCIWYAARDRQNHVTKKKWTILFEKPLEENVSMETAAENNALFESEDVLFSTGAPVLQMQSQEAILQVGEVFDYGQYVAGIADDQDGPGTLYPNLRVDGEYDTNQPGTYQLQFYTYDSDGNKSNVIDFRLDVTEW